MKGCNKTIKVIALGMLVTLGLTACSGSGGSASYSDATSAVDSSMKSNSYVAGSSSGFASGYNGDSYDYSNDSYDDYYEESYESEVEEEYTEENNYETEDSINRQSESNVNSNNKVVLVEDKLVYRCYVDIETLDFDESYAMLQSMMEEYDCVISSETFGDDSISYLYDDYYYPEGNRYKTGRTDEIVIRVPSANYKEFISEYGELGNVTSKTQTVDNITQEYYDTSYQVDGLKAEMERLEIMMDQATEIEDMITINQAITDLESRINSLTTQLRTMDSDVAYSYVTLSLKEVLEYSDVEEPVKTNKFIDRLKNQCVDTWKGFLSFLENLLFTLISLIPAIVILGIIYVIVRVVFRRKIKEYKENRKAKKNELKAMLKYGENSVNNMNDVSSMSGMNTETNMSSMSNGNNAYNMNNMSNEVDADESRDKK